MCAFVPETEYVDGTAVPEQHTSFSHLDACAFITLSLTAVLTGTRKNIGSKNWMSHLLSNLYWMIFRYNTLIGVSSNMSTFDPDDLYKINSLILLLNWLSTLSLVYFMYLLYQQCPTYKHPRQIFVMNITVSFKLCHMMLLCHMFM